MLVIKEERQLEQDYLMNVYDQLQERKIQLEALLAHARENGLSDVQQMLGDVRLNFSNISDNLDTYAALEMKNREIDQLNIKLRSAEQFLQKVDRLLVVPYFGKITVDFLEEEPQESFYIGVNGFANDLGEYLIYDWRSPIAELFYNNEMGKSSYVVNRQTIPVELKQRRQLIVEGQQLLNYFDTSISIQDDVLLQVLGSDATRQMQDITSTIQKEQNVIIRDVTHRNLLVNGVAGSGKTSTIMQRIAYLLFQYREQITTDNVMILSPNRQFVDYISDVLPSLGEMNPMNVTILQFIDHHLPFILEDEATYFNRISSKQVVQQTEIIRSHEFLETVKTADYLFKDASAFVQPLMHQGKVVISKTKICVFFDATPHDARLMDRIQGTKIMIRDEWQRRLKKQSRKPKMQDQMLSMSEDMQRKYFGKILGENAEKNLPHYAKKVLDQKYRQVTEDIEDLRWLDTSYLFKTIFKTYTGEAYAFNVNQPLSLDEGVVFLLIYQELVERLDLPKLKFLFVDEVQDYTPAQLNLILTLFPKARYTMVGDENQAIFNSTSAFEQIVALFSAFDLPSYRYDLRSSYRSTGSITTYFGELTAAEQEMAIVPIREEGAKPIEWQYQSEQEWLERMIEEAMNLESGPLVVLTKTSLEAETIRQQLSKLTVDMKKIKILPITLAKGLEFDHVVIYNASKLNYVSERDRRILYTMASRAMRTLLVTYQEAPSQYIK
ncbi:ATP-dependent DNA helicase IV [Vagococcus silagei]|uniref:ATP-dependent DNA helicase IV n=1 Tax=Vagococcus silagei TaxID=2508885 RepID=A0A4S3B6E1_9ENTE|nr:ATP-dependent DNA helicase IV [Vagococcus silagei]